MTTVERLCTLLERYAKIHETYVLTYAELAEVRDYARAGKFTKEELVNFIYVLREMSRHCDDLRKETDQVSKLLEKVCCAIYVTGESTESIRASLATGTPDLKLDVVLPNASKEPEAFAALMNHFNIDPQAVLDKVVQPYWPGICAKATAMAAEGKSLPGIDPKKTYPAYSVRIRPAVQLDELVRNMAGESEETCAKMLTERSKK